MKPFLVAGLAGIALLGPALSGLTALPAQDWDRFRGPEGSGSVEDASIPASWGPDGFAFVTKLPGKGHSSPIVQGGRVFLTSAEEDGAVRIVLAVRAADGSIEWTRRFPSRTFPKHNFNSYASSSPAADADRVYVSFGTPGSLLLIALDHAGKDVWSRDLGPFKSQHGSGASPVVFEDLVVLADEQDGDSSLVAVDAKTGADRWRTPRRAALTCYATPVLYTETDGKPALLFSSKAHGLASIDPRTGAERWEARVFDKRCVGSAIVAGGLALGACGSGEGGNFVAAVRIGGTGDVTESHFAFKVTRAAPYVPTPITRGDLLFLWGDLGVLTCLELPSGKTVWQDRVQGNFAGSPVRAGDRLFAISVGGEVVCVAAGREFKLLGRSPLGEGTRSTPAIAGGALYLRTESRLFKVAGKEMEKSAAAAQAR